MNKDKQSNSGASASAGASASGDGASSVAPLARFFLWTDSEASVDRFIRILSYICVVLFLIDIVWHRHTKVPGEGLWGFYAIIGFVFFVLLVVASRLLRLFVQRDVSFYGAQCVDAEQYPEAGTQPMAHSTMPEESLKSLGNEMLGRAAPDNGQGGASS